MRRPPDHLGEHGRRLWAELGHGDLTTRQVDALEQLAVAADVLDRLGAAVAAAEVLVAGSTNQPVPNRLIGELRAQQDHFRALWVDFAGPDRPRTGVFGQPATTTRRTTP